MATVGNFEPLHFLYYDQVRCMWIFLSILWKSVIIQIIWFLRRVSSIILVFMLVLRVACLVGLPLSLNISCSLKRISYVMAMSMCCCNTLLRDPSISQWAFLSALCHWEWTFFSSYKESSLGIDGKRSWVTHFNCSTMSTISRFLF